jgi:hypothetical protein
MFFYKNTAEAMENKDYKGEQVGEAVMSPAHAKALLAALSDQIGSYEKTFGAISLEPLKGEE